MSNHFGPETCAADEIRCEALVPASSQQYFNWTKKAHRCTRRAITGRGGFLVCHIHNRTRTATKWTGGPDLFRPRRIFGNTQ